MAFEKQLQFATYYDSNPRENINAIESVFGVKGRALFRFERSGQKSITYGSVLGQGFLEPHLLSDSKVIMNADVGIQYLMLPAWQATLKAQSFQKLYIQTLESSGKSSVQVSFKHINPIVINTETGIVRSSSYISNGSLLRYTDTSAFLSLNKMISQKMGAEIRLQGGEVQFHDYPARNYEADTLYLSISEDQRDRSWLVGGQLKYAGSIIWGISLSFEDIRSNSVVDESTILAGKIYASSRMGKHMFIHLVMQGMNKFYSISDFPELNPHRDPEENIQNQFHMQIDRVLSDRGIFYIQCSVIKNETIFNHWFYNKYILETGIKLSI